MIHAVLLDLDETLYDEASYVASGLKVIAKHFADQFHVDPFQLFDVMQNDIRCNGRGSAFNAALRSIGVKDSEYLISVALNIYRDHQPSIKLYEDAKEFLIRLRSNLPTVRIGLITDGLESVQRKKVSALNLAETFNQILYCLEHSAPKPSIKGFKHLATELMVSPAECVMIGDRVDHDLKPAKSLGMRTIRIARGRYRGQPSPPHLVDLSLPSFDGVLAYLKSL